MGITILTSVRMDHPLSAKPTRDTESWIFTYLRADAVLLTVDLDILPYKVMFRWLYQSHVFFMSATVFYAVQYLFMINIVMYIYLYLLFSSFNLFFYWVVRIYGCTKYCVGIHVQWHFKKKDYKLYRGNLINEVNLHIYY